MVTQLLKLIWVWFFGWSGTKKVEPVEQVKPESADLKSPTFSANGGFVSPDSVDKQSEPTDEYDEHQETLEKNKDAPTADDEWKKWQDKFHGQG